MPQLLSQQALDVLSNSTADPSNLTVKLPPGDLPRPLYEEVDDCLQRLGGKWNRRARAHLFPYDPEPLLKGVIASGELPPKNPTAFFPTPAPVVEAMLESVFGLWPGCRVLEPSAGTGAIARAVRQAEPEAVIHCCEILPVNRAALEAEGFEVVGGDFLSYQPDELYDVILMNPPFSLEGDKQAYITHIYSAWSLLKENGRLAAITPTGWMTGSTKRLVEFRRWVCDRLDFEEIGAGAFAESGTQVNTLLLYGRKEAQLSSRRAYNGWGSWQVWNFSLWVDNEQELSNGLRKCVADRAKFEEFCSWAERELVSRKHVACSLRIEDIEELWEHYQSSLE